MSPSELIDALGGTGQVARKAGVSPPSVSEWRRSGIPRDKLIVLAAELEVATSRRVTRHGLFPQDWHRIWPELITAEGAPPVPGANDQEVRDAA